MSEEGLLLEITINNIPKMCGRIMDSKMNSLYIFLGCTSRGREYSLRYRFNKVDIVIDDDGLRTIWINDIHVRGDELTLIEDKPLSHIFNKVNVKSAR